MNNRGIGYCVLLLLLAAVLVVGGCSGRVEDLVARPVAKKPGDAGDNPPPSPPPLPPPPPPARGPVGGEPDGSGAENEIPVEPPAVPASVPPAAKPLAAKPQAAAPSPGAPSIRLSAGVALAQTLTTGTAMGFSVDYEFTQGRPARSSPYFLVIEPAKGPPAKIRVQLSGKGTLPGFVVGWRPEHGPFEGHIEDAGGNRLSRSSPFLKEPDRSRCSARWAAGVAGAARPPTSGRSQAVDIPRACALSRNCTVWPA